MRNELYNFDDNSSDIYIESFFIISDLVPFGECVSCDSSVDANCAQAPENIEPQKCSDPADRCYSRIVSKYSLLIVKPYDDPIL